MQIRAERAVESLLGGEYRSAFHGSGLIFEDVREYQPGDDVRALDWNVTARMGLPFVKRFTEERELTVLLMVDCSASLTDPKREVAAELAALIAFAAMHQNDRVGFLAFTDRVESHLPPAKGTRHALRLVRDILGFRAAHPGTDLAGALDHLLQTHRRRAVVFLLSDFLGDGYEPSFRRVAKRHELIAVRISEPLENAWPAVGLVDVQDPETGERLLIDTNDGGFRAGVERLAKERSEAFRKLALSAGAGALEVVAGDDPAKELEVFLRRRGRRR